MNTHSEKIYSKSMIHNFLLMTNNNRGLLLIVCEIISRMKVEKLAFCLLYSVCRPTVGESPATSMYSIHR